MLTNKRKCELAWVDAYFFWRSVQDESLVQVVLSELFNGYSRLINVLDLALSLIECLDDAVH